MERLEGARAELGLQVHGLLLGDSNAQLEELCSHIHVFKSWSTDKA